MFQLIDQGQKWTNDVVFNVNTTIEEAISLAESGHDGGAAGARLFKPESNCRVVRKWFDYSRYLGRLCMAKNVFDTV